MNKTFCRKIVDTPDPANPIATIQRTCGGRLNLGDEMFQCQECKAQNPTSQEPTPFEVVNANGITWIKHEDITLINLNNVAEIGKTGGTLRLLLVGSDKYIDFDFNDHAEAQAAFDAIMGKVAPITKELKDHKAQNKANEQSQAIDL